LVDSYSGGGAGDVQIPPGSTSDAVVRRPPARNAIVFILFTIALDATGIGILIPIVPKLVEQLGGVGLERAAIFGGWLTALFAIVQFFAGPVLGGLSDHFGRRPVLLASLAAFGTSYVLMGFAPTLAWLFVAQALAGLFGATPGTAAAYIADSTRPEQRARLFGAMGAAFGVGLVIGPVLGGLLSEFGTRVPFFVAASLCLGNVLFGIFVLPESLAAASRRPFHWSRAHPVGAFLELRKYPGVTRLMTGVLIMQVVIQTLPTTWPYYTMHKLEWTPRMVGYSLGVYGITNILVQSFLTGRIAAWLGNLKMAEFGFLAIALGYVGFAFSGHTVLMFACIPLTVLGFVTQPALVSLMSATVGPTAQGSLQGMVASATSLAAMGTPLVMPALFSRFAASDAPLYFPGAPYLLAAALATVGSLIVLRGARR
jgi:DHA1 family tetracycline resistance protein-like MFS transporter